MSRNQIGFRAAKNEAKKSLLRSHRVGSVIMSGKSIVSVGYNTKKTHPDCQTNYTQHAEFSACRNILHLSKRNNFTIYVVRLTRTGRVGISKPCPDCKSLLIQLGINRVVFSTDDGNMESIRWN